MLQNTLRLLPADGQTREKFANIFSKRFSPLICNSFSSDGGKPK
jgi:hypothetical protein